MPSADRLRRILARGPAVSAVESQHVFARLRSRLFGAPLDPKVLGRYVLLEHRGGGARSEVFAAYDTKLDRKVALKLLSATTARASALEEARILAGVSHRNVVTVFDAGTFVPSETGETDDRIYLSMELVGGRTLREWLAVVPRRSWREIVRAFVEAGTGLLAAHQAGIIHCDFKPDNVVVGDDGTIKVVDFGLAQWTADDDAPEHGVSGTPLYMAPEQHAGGPPDPRVDQFAFCVALFEALFAHAPFEGARVQQLAVAKQQGDVRLPTRGRIPRGLWHVVRRGLDPSPGTRYPHMGMLVAELQRCLDRKGRLVRLGTLAGVALAGAGTTMALAPASSCEDPAALLGPVWNPAVKQHAAEAFVATGLAHAPHAWAATQTRIDAWADAWQEARRATCALPLREGQVRRVCLDGELLALTELVTMLGAPDALVVRDGTIAADALPPIADCQAADTAAARVDGAESEGFERALARIRGLYNTGHYDDARKQADTLMTERGGTIGLRAKGRLDLMRGQARGKAGDLEGAEQALLQAWEAAERTGDARLAAWAVVRLVWITSSKGDSMDAAEALASLADAKLDALGGPPELLGELETVRGHLYVARDPGIARVHYERALQAHRLAHGEDDRRVAETLVNLGIALDERGDHVGARERFEAALAIWEPLLGPEHPLVVQTGYSIGVGLLREDQPEAARPHFERAVASDCSDPVLAAHYQQALGSTLASLEGPDAGLPLFEAAHAAFLETLGPDHFETARSKLNLGRARVERGDTDAGLPMLVAAAAVLEETLGPDHPVVTEARTALASARQLAAAQ